MFTLQVEEYVPYLQMITRQLYPHLVEHLAQFPAVAFYEATLDTTLSHLPTTDPETWPDLEMWAFPMSDEAEPSYGAAGSLVKMGGSLNDFVQLMRSQCEDF